MPELLQLPVLCWVKFDFNQLDTFLFRSVSGGGTGRGVLRALGPSHGGEEKGLGCEARARSREHGQWQSDGVVRQSEKGKSEDQDLPFNLEGKADQPFNGNKIILTLHVAKK
jgi:hypothetical protein